MARRPNKPENPTPVEQILAAIPAYLLTPKPEPLLPCPFCGQAPEQTGEPDSIGCANVACDVVARAASRNAWNTRWTPPAAEAPESYALPASECWLIRSGSGLYFAGAASGRMGWTWTEDTRKAIQFPRECDAARIIDVMDWPAATFTTQRCQKINHAPTPPK